MRIRVGNIITSLEVGGAEIVLERLLSDIDRSRFDCFVLCLGDGGPIADRIAAQGWSVECLGLRRNAPAPTAIWSLLRSLRRRRPAVVQTWMYHSDLVGGLAARATGVGAVAWGLHQTDLPADHIPAMTRSIAAVNDRLSRVIPDVVVCSSESARRAHIARGYPSAKMEVIRNGFPTTAPARLSPTLRTELGVPDDTVLIGRIGRHHAQKDHASFLRAVRSIVETGRDVHVVMCGRDIDWSNGELVAQIDECGLRRRTHLLGERHDVAAVHQALDIAVSSSAFGETFPLVVGEAMMAGTPVVTTDVGDCADLVGDTGVVVPASDTTALADALALLVDAGSHRRAEMGGRARDRAVEVGSIAQMVHSYEALYECLAGARS